MQFILVAHLNSLSSVCMLTSNHGNGWRIVLIVGNYFSKKFSPEFSVQVQEVGCLTQKLVQNINPSNQMLRSKSQFVSGSFQFSHTIKRASVWKQSDRIKSHKNPTWKRITIALRSEWHKFQVLTDRTADASVGQREVSLLLLGMPEMSQEDSWQFQMNQNVFVSCDIACSLALHKVIGICVYISTRVFIAVLFLTKMGKQLRYLSLQGLMSYMYSIGEHLEIRKGMCFWAMEQPTEM